MLKTIVILSLVYTVVSLIFLLIRTTAFGRTSKYAASQGNVVKGVIYAFGQGMMPWAKESAAKHLPTFFAGILYHVGILSGVVILISSLFDWSLSPALTLIVRIGLIAGLACGLGLLVKRISISYMRFISCPDDYLSNMLVNIFLAAALFINFGIVSQAVLFWVVIVLALYVPLGKIRHCIFFFYTRILFGAFFGYRGVLPNRTLGK